MSPALLLPAGFAGLQAYKVHSCGPGFQSLPSKICLFLRSAVTPQEGPLCLKKPCPPIHLLLAVYFLRSTYCDRKLIGACFYLCLEKHKPRPGWCGSAD